MKKMFVILLTICLFLLPSCKEELPGAKINIVNETGKSPETYELEILFDDSRTTNTRAFHMKNIGSEIVTSARSIVLENMPKTIYVAEVKAYDGNGKQIGIGTSESFQASSTASINVYVQEMPFAYCLKNFRFPLGSVDTIKLNARDIDGNLILDETYSDLSGTTFKPVKTGKIRIDSNASTLEWILLKADNAVAVYIDTLSSSLVEGETRNLAEVSLEMGFTEITDWTANTEKFDKITLKVVPDEKLRDTIAGFKFNISNREGNTGEAYRDLSSDNLYELSFAEDEIIPHTITVTPVLKDGTTEVKSLAQTVTAHPNIALKSIDFVGVDVNTVNKLELGIDTLEFDVRKNPENYTAFGKGEIEKTPDSSATFQMTDDGHVTITPTGIGTTTLTYKEPVYNKSQSITVDVSLHTPILKLDASGSDVRLTWDYIHPDSTAYIKGTSTYTDEYGKKTEKEISIPLSSNQKEYNESIGKRTTIDLYLEVSHTGASPVMSNTVTHSTGDNSFVNIIIPDLDRFNVEFEHDLTIDEPLKMGTKVELRAVKNNDVKNIAWRIDGKTISSEDTFVYSPDDPEYGLKPNSEIARTEILLVVETTKGELYSKNIRLTYIMESEI